MSLDITMTYVLPDGSENDESNYASNNSNTSYGDFAATMNNNSSIDMGAVNSIDWGAVMENYSQSVEQSMYNSLKNADFSGIDLGFDLTGVVPSIDGVSAENSGEPGTPSDGKTGSEEVVGDGVTESEEVVGDGVTESEEVVGDGAANSNATAQPIVGVPSWSGAMGSQDEWMAEQGYDPDGDYDNAKAALEYDYETSMATYGRKAEELAQMGLSNSGLSDIYQLGAYNSYIQAQNDLANQRIAAKKKYKQEYNALFKENEAAFKTDIANAYNFGLSIYDENNADFVRQQLGNQGYDASVIDQVMSSLSSLDAATLPTVKAQIEQDNSDISNALKMWGTNYTSAKEQEVRDYYAAQDWSTEKIQKLIDQLTPLGIVNQSNQDKADITNALEMWGTNYTPANEQEVRDYYAAQDWSTEKIQKLIDQLTPLGIENQKKQDEANRKQHEADINSVAASIADSYDEDKEAGIRQLYSDWANIDLGNGKTKLDALIEKLNGYAAAFAPSEEEMIRNGIALYGSSYTGSEADKTAIRQKLRGTEYEKYADKIIAQLDKDASEAKTSKFNDTIAKIEKSDIGGFDMSSVSSVLNDVKNEYGRDSEEYATIKTTVGRRIDQLFEEAFEDKNGALADAYGLAGKSAEDWASMDDGERIIALLSATDAWCRAGYLDDFSMRDKYFDAWYESEFIEVKGDPKLIAQMQKQVKSFYEDGFIGQSDYEAWTKTLRALQTAANAQAIIEVITPPWLQ